MPRIDSGPTDGPPGRELATVWVSLTPAEAEELLLALQVWAEEPEAVPPDWHCHITDATGRELTIEITGNPNGRVERTS